MGKQNVMSSSEATMQRCVNLDETACGMKLFLSVNHLANREVECLRLFHRRRRKRKPARVASAACRNHWHHQQSCFTK